jgi:glycosyltransferase involved in cell wall biosynthesis
VTGEGSRAVVSVVVITLNEEAVLRDCLESVKWADDVVVLDSFSRDRTCEIAREYTSRVYQQPFLGDGPAKNAAIGMAVHDWILVLDADERVSPELREEIARLLESPRCEGYEIPYRVYFLGRWMKHGGFGRERHLRLFRRSAAAFTDAPAHAYVVVRGRTGRLRNPILHYTCVDLRDYIAKLNSHTDLIARDESRTSSVLGAFLHAVVRFLRVYVLRGGFLDGREGFVVAALLSYYVLIKHLKLWRRPTAPPVG